MKKQTNFFLTMALAIMTVFSGFAQTHELKPLYQIFTSSTCAPCYGGNIVLDDVLNQNPDEYALIKYQVNWPGSGDPYYIQAAGDRVNYYNVTGVPEVFVNQDGMSPFVITQELFDSYVGEMTSMGITVNNAEVTEAGQISFEIVLDVDTDYAAGLTLQVVVLERNTRNNVGNNNETEFHNVMLHMFPDANGTALGALTVGNAQTFSYAYDMTQTFMEEANDLRIVAFVQNDSDKAIIQSEMAEVTPLFDTYTATFTVENCAGSIAGAYVEFEGGAANITNANGELVFDRLVNGTYAYNVSAGGLLPSSGSITISDDNASQDVVLVVPTDAYYQDFTNGIPETWTIYEGGTSDYIYMYEGTVMIVRQSDGALPLMLVSEAINVDGADIISFDLGEQAGDPICGLGYLTDPSDVNTYVELETYNVGINMETYEYSVVDLSGDVYFAWNFNGASSSMSWFSLDNVILEGEAIVVPPAGLAAVVENTTDAILSWSDYGCAETIDGFNVYRSIDGADFELLASGVADPTFADTDLDNGQYAYYVTVTVDGIESLGTNMVTLEIESIVMPPAPMNLTLELDGFYGIILNWDAYSKGFDFYSVYRSVDAGDYVVVAPNLTEPTYSETDLEDALYEYYVTVTVDGVESLASDVVAMLITSLNNVEANNTRVYPNPASNMINIASDLTIESINIFNQAGQLVKTQKLNSSSFNQDISDLPKGIYMIQLKTVNTIITKRIIKE
ncbi:MAG: Omp28-related outer membrane protein [Bacteroidales bacterium]|nr:Omp28-related outer membrane protein [Bacteroidales bacterium]